MEAIGPIKTWMIEHLFVTIGVAVALAVALTILVMYMVNVGSKNVYLLLFRLTSACGVALGIAAMAVGLGSGGTWTTVEVGGGIVVVSLVSYISGMRHAMGHASDHVATKNTLAKTQAELAKLKDNPNNSIRLVVDPSPQSAVP